jgi:hypothetical protein
VCVLAVYLPTDDLDQLAHNDSLGCDLAVDFGSGGRHRIPVQGKRGLIWALCCQSSADLNRINDLENGFLI